MHSCCISSDVCECFKFSFYFHFKVYACLLSNCVYCCCLLFVLFVPMYMHICTFRIRRLLLAACSYLVLDVLCITYATNYHLFFCHRVKYTCSNILDTINIIIITHLKTKLEKMEKKMEKTMTYTHIYTYT